MMNSTNPKLTIITPVFNGEKFIEKCMLNVINQDCKDIEHIIVDGGSSDNTVNIVTEFSQKFNHIRWISEKDEGQSDAMNKGIELAKSKVISFLNVDDYYEPGVFKKILIIFEELPEGSLLVGNCKVVDENDTLLYTRSPSHLRLADLLVGTDIFPHPINPSSYFYSKSIHDLIGGYDIESNYIMDLEFFLRAVQVANIVYVNEDWGNFRYLEGTKTFEINQRGGNWYLKKKLFQKYQKDLPLFQRLILKPRIIYYNNLKPILRNTGTPLWKALLLERRLPKRYIELFNFKKLY